MSFFASLPKYTLPIARALLATACIAVLSAMALAAILASDRTPPVRQLYNRVVNEARVVPGGMIRVESAVVRSRLCKTTVSPVILDSGQTRIILPSLHFDKPGGGIGPASYSQVFPLPATISPGPATIQFVLTWECNPMHAYWPIVFVTEPAEFNVRGP